MRALTVRQPWAWAIIHGGKGIENRTRNLAGGYRGPVAIHAGLVFDPGYSIHVLKAWSGAEDLDADHHPQVYGAFIGVADLASVHHDSDHGRRCCPGAPWAEDGTWHLVCENPRPLAKPIPARGRLGLWTPDPELLLQIKEAAQ